VTCLVVIGSDIEDRFRRSSMHVRPQMAAQRVSQPLGSPLLLLGGEHPLAVVEALSTPLSGQEGEMLAGVANVDAGQGGQLHRAHRVVLSEQLRSVVVGRRRPHDVFVAAGLLVPRQGGRAIDVPAALLTGRCDRPEVDGAWRTVSWERPTSLAASVVVSRSSFRIGMTSVWPGAPRGSQMVSPHPEESRMLCLGPAPDVPSSVELR
jgi:hypothetical protein